MHNSTDDFEADMLAAFEQGELRSMANPDEPKKFKSRRWRKVCRTKP